jgi:four helix bundle protein
VDELPNLLNRIHQFAVAAFEFYDRLPPSSKGRTAGEQFYRASTSAESNYRAAKRGRSRAEFIAKLGVAVEEIDEAVGWLEHMRDARIAADPMLLDEAEQLRRILGRSLGTARRNQRIRNQRRKNEDSDDRP